MPEDESATGSDPLDTGLFSAGRTCVICGTNNGAPTAMARRRRVLCSSPVFPPVSVDYAGFPCVCNDTCYDCYSKERDAGSASQFHCPTCMKEVEEMVHQHDHAALMVWAKKFRDEETVELLDRGERVRRWGVWQEFIDPESATKFWHCSKTNQLTWEKPPSVVKAESTERCALRRVFLVRGSF